MPMGKKNSYDLSEDSKIREVTLHHHRFSRFLRFLKEKEAIIKFSDYDKVSKEKFTLTYSSDKNKSHLTIENLVSYSLRLSENQANDYTREQLGLDDKHSGGDRVNSIGRIIESITVYYENEKENSFPMNILSMDSPFSFRKYLSIIDREMTAKDKIDKNTLENFILFQPLKESRSDLSSYLDYHSSMPYRIRLFNHSTYPFKKELYELLYYLEDDSPDYSTFHIELFEPFFKEVLEYYVQPISYDPEIIGKSTFSPVIDLIIPDHIDFKYPYDKDYSLKRFPRSFRDVACKDLNSKLSFKSLMSYRYAILWHLTNEKYPVMKWDLELQGILLVTTLEHIVIYNIVNQAADYILDRLRFELVASVKNNNPNYQEHSITAERLSRVLAGYMFPKGLDDTLIINGNSILESKVVRYPEPGVAVGAYDHKTIYNHIKKMLQNHLFERIRVDLNLPKLIGFND